MPRKPSNKTEVSNEQEIQAEVLQTLDENQNSAATLQSLYTEERDILNHMMGQIEMTSAISKLTTVIGLTKLAHIKETKMYRAFQGKKLLDDKGNEIADVSTWEGFCLAIGTTRQKVDEDLRNLKAFGEEALSDLSRVGAGYRDLRQYRKLPEDSKQALIEAAKDGDKDTFVDIAEEIISKHSKEREEWEKREEEYKADIEAKEAVAETNRKRIDKLQEQAQRIKKLPPNESLDQLRDQLNGLADEVEFGIRVDLKTAFSELTNFGVVHPEFTAQISDYVTSRLDLLDKSRLQLRGELGIERLSPLSEKPEWEEDK